MKHLWEAQDNFIRPDSPSDPIPPSRLSDICDKFYDTENERGLCIRANRAALVFTKDIFKNNELSYAQLSRQATSISFFTPSLRQVLYTYDEHPSAQCRLDTLFAGSIGARKPRCWFAPNQHS